MNRKSFRITIEIGLFIVFLVAFVVINEQITDNKKNSFIVIQDSNNYSYQIENLIMNEDNIAIKGWFFEIKKVRNVELEVKEGSKIGIILYDLNCNNEGNIYGSANAKKGIKTTVRLNDRADINAYFKCEYDYSRCGFTAQINKSAIDMENGKYQIIIKPDEDDNIGIISAYLVDGKLCYVNPSDELKLNVKGTDLEKIVNDGKCLASVPEYNICVYQYGWKLYWIANKNAFDGKKSTYISYLIDTTQFDRLPIEIINTGYYYNNLGAPFELYEITDMINSGEYRVAVRDLPKEYSVTGIMTGNYVDGVWLWQKFFRPIYGYKD